MSESDVISLLREILKWVKFIGWRHVKDVLTDVLNTDRAKLIYHYSDGRSLREIADLLGVSPETVRYYWKKWASLGIVDTVRVKGGGFRCIRMFSLEELGIEIPSLEEVKMQKKRGRLKKVKEEGEQGHEQ